ncbi:hypothetical protein Mal4_55640 [Maioricimonas rarisocia]|uniref:Uncharacterized protein n=1 Tax=Maioricimonas rarisocia TaxID=2528026 RepID=A0A517ZFI4_9PLAN|nr:twin-arginine translocation signal domain-containing protein [Maioricimonas rarisocia]QDU41199.1 hypothetical protein Mal4_55640 [Maioricimonas rarisocia]
MTDRERKLTRRRFLQHSAMGTAMSAAAAGIVLRSDAQTGDKGGADPMSFAPGDPSPYAYHDEEWEANNGGGDGDGGDGGDGGGGGGGGG